MGTSMAAMDTTFHPEDHFTTPPTLRHQLPSSPVVDEFNNGYIHIK